LLDRHLVRLLVDEVKPLGRAVEDGTEIGAHDRHEPFRLADRGREPGGRIGVLGAFAGEGVGCHDLHSERA